MTRRRTDLHDFTKGKTGRIRVKRPNFMLTLGIQIPQRHVGKDRKRDADPLASR